MDYNYGLYGLSGILGNNTLGSFYQPYNVLGNNSSLTFQNILNAVTAYNSSSWQNRAGLGLLDSRIQAGLNSVIGESAVVVPTVAALDEDGNISHYLLSGKKLVEETEQTSTKKAEQPNAKKASQTRSASGSAMSRAIKAYQTKLLESGLGIF